MKVLLALCFLLAIVSSQDLSPPNITVRCNPSDLVDYIGTFFLKCSTEIGAFLSVGDLGSQASLDVRLSLECDVALRGIVRYGVCDKLFDPALWSTIAFTAPPEDQLRSLIRFALVVARRNDQAPGISRCTLFARNGLLNATQAILTNCASITDETSLPDTCKPDCRAARDALLRFNELCLDDINMVNALSTEVTARLRVVNNVCDRALRRLDSIEDCLRFRPREVYENLTRVCDVSSRNDSLSVECLLAVKRVTPAILRCVRLVGLVNETLRDEIYPQEFLRDLRAWFQRTGDEVRDTWTNKTDRGFVYTSVNPLAPGRPTSVTEIGVDFNRGSLFMKLVNLVENRLERAIRFTLIKLAWINRNISLIDVYDDSLHASSAFHVHTHVNASEFNNQLNGAITSDVDASASADVDVPAIPENNENIVQDIPLGFSKLGRVHFNHICSDRADRGRFGVETRAGVCKHTITFNDIPHPDPTTPLDLVICFEVDYNSSAVINVEQNLPFDASDVRPDINGTDGESSRISFDDIRFGFRRWAFCNGRLGRQRLEVRAKCTDPIMNPVGLEDGTDARRVCCLTLVRDPLDVDVYTTCTFDPTVDGSVTDNNLQPVPTRGSTGGSIGSSGSTGGSTNGSTNGSTGGSGTETSSSTKETTQDGSATYLAAGVFLLISLL